MSVYFQHVIRPIVSFRGKREFMILFNSMVYYLEAHVILKLAGCLSFLIHTWLNCVFAWITGSRSLYRGFFSRSVIDFIKGGLQTNPGVSLLIAGLSLVLFRQFASRRFSAGILLVWMIIQGFADFSGGIVARALFNHGMCYVFTCFRVMDTGRVVISILCIYFVLLMSILLTRTFLFTANVYYNDLKGKARFRFGIVQFLIPFVLWNFMTTLIELPQINIINILIRVSALIILVPLIVNTVYIHDLYFDEEPRPASVSPGPLVITLLMLICFFSV